MKEKKKFEDERSLLKNSSSKEREEDDIYQEGRNAFRMERRWRERYDCFVAHPLHGLCVLKCNTQISLRKHHHFQQME